MTNGPRRSINVTRCLNKKKLKYSKNLLQKVSTTLFTYKTMLSKYLPKSLPYLGSLVKIFCPKL